MRVLLGLRTWITPPHAHWHWAPSTRAGWPPITVVVAPLTHGVVAGTHGMGVRTPSADAVAAATVGFASDVHMPNVGMFTSGVASTIVAAGLPSTSTRDVGSTISDAGAAPKLHIIMAVAATAGLLIGSPPVHHSLPATDAVSCSPVVVMKHSVVRSASRSQLRGDGTRYVKNSVESR